MGRAALAVAAVLVGLSACGGSASGGSNPARPAAPPVPSVSSAPAPVGPPKAFRSGQTGQFLGVAQAVDDRYAYQTSGSTDVAAIRLADGETAWRVGLPDAVRSVMPSIGVELTPLRLVGSTVVVAYERFVEGTGTSLGHHAIAVVGLRAADGKAVWQAELAAGDGSYPRDLGFPHLPGVRGDRLLVSTETGGRPGFSAVLDLDTTKALWSDDNLEAYDLEDSVVVGRRGSDQLVGLDVATGRAKWKRAGLNGASSARDPGPGLTLAEFDTGDLFSHSYDSAFLDPETGATSLQIKGGFELGARCIDDQQGIAVCSLDAALVAVELKSGRKLWQLPDSAARRIRPRLYGAWHGVVYATAHDAALTLDARTGRDLNPAAGQAPYLVTPRYGLVRDLDTTHIYPARG